MTSCVLICQASDRVSANLLAQSFGYGPNNFSVALSSDGSEPATYYAGNAASVAAEFVGFVTMAKAGTLPPMEWPDGLTDEIILEFFPRLTFDFENEWDDVLDGMGISIVSVELP